MSYTEGKVEEELEGEGKRIGSERRGGGEVSRKVEEEGGEELEPPRALPSTTDLERDKEGLESESWSESESEEVVGGEKLPDAIFTIDAWCALDCGEGVCHQVNSPPPSIL